MHNFTPTDVGVFLLKMCKMSTFFFFFFSILHNFASTDIVAFREEYKLSCLIKTTISNIIHGFLWVPCKLQGKIPLESQALKTILSWVMCQDRALNRSRGEH